MWTLLYCALYVHQGVNKKPLGECEEKERQKTFKLNLLGHCRKITGQFYGGSLFPHCWLCQCTSPRWHQQQCCSISIVVSASSHSCAIAYLLDCRYFTGPCFPEIQMNLFHTWPVPQMSVRFPGRTFWLKPLYNRFPVTLHQPKHVQRFD